MNLILSKDTLKRLNGRIYQTLILILSEKVKYNAVTVGMKMTAIQNILKIPNAKIMNTINFKKKIRRNDFNDFTKRKK